MSGWDHRDADPDLAPCGHCGKDVVLDHDPPCAHGYVGCPECTHAAVCADCRKQAERDMYESGEYSPAADPFYDPSREDADAAYWAAGPREVPGAPGTFRYPEGA